MGLQKTCLLAKKIVKAPKIVKRVRIGFLLSAKQRNRHLRLVLKTALPSIKSMGLAVACEGLVRQHFRPWKIVPTSVMGIVTYARMLLLGGALTEWREMTTTRI
jgi:hypothetical protein